MTKQERKEKAALLQRITDIYSGALGQAWTEDDFATAYQLSKVLPALKEIFGGQRPSIDVAWSLRNLDEFDNPEKAAEFLYWMGFRA